MKNKGFTLAELLIALAILGVIATFTIPKVLTSSTNGQMTAIAKEVAGMISGAQQAKTQVASIASTEGPNDLTSYMNYVKMDTSAAFITTGPSTVPVCNAGSGSTCLHLHNGGVLQYENDQDFGGTSATHAVYFNLDPDGTSAQLPITFVLSYNGRLTTGANSTVNVDHLTTANGAVKVATDPPYLSTWN